MAHVVFLDPYHGPSHAALSTTLRDRSRHGITLLSLPPRKWKWRMRGAAFAFDEALRRLPRPPDLLIATDMLNLPELLGIGRRWLPARLPVFTYFHENQITYPLPSRDERDVHFGLANIYTALASDRVVFNSDFHREEFLGALPGFLKAMPDLRPEGIADTIREQSDVLGVPIDLPRLGPHARPAGDPIILWNHRWEEDKNPAAFFRAMRRLADRGLPFRLMILGQSFATTPACFEEGRRALAPRIEHWGYLASREEYLRMVSRCSIVVSTARHEYFGLAVREAVGLGCWPLLPRRVVYPELTQGLPGHLYDTEDELVARLGAILSGPIPHAPSALRDAVAAISPARVVARWDAWISEAAGDPG